LPPDREQLIRQFVAVSHELAEMAKHKVVPNLVSDREGELLEELDRIEYELGGGYSSAQP
jgi:hypothetical protein